MRRAYRYKARLNATQRAAATWQLARCCELYNAALQERRDAWATGVSVTASMQSRQLPEMKHVRPEYRDIGSQVLQDVLQRLDRAFQAFFRRVKAGQTPGYPRFKASRRYDSLTFKQVGWSLGECSATGRKRKVTLHGVGTFWVHWSRDLEGQVKTVTLARDAVGDFFVVFSCVEVPEQPLELTGAVVGLDVGIESFVTTSDAAHFASLQPLRDALVRLRHANRRAAKRKRGSHRQRKAYRQVARVHRRVGNVRRDVHHRVARQLVEQYDVVCVEDLNVRGLARGILARQCNDAGWGQFLQCLDDKAASAGRLVVRVDPRGTSQVCSECGCVPEVRKPLRQRWHRCDCGYAAHRDVNAARNILAKGRAGPSASGLAFKAAA